MPAKILNSAHWGNDHYIHIFLADFSIFLWFLKPFLRLLLWFRHLAKMIVTTVTFRCFWSGCYVLLPNWLKWYSNGSSIIDCLWTWEVELVIDYIVTSVEWVADLLNNCAGNLSPTLRARVQQGSKDSYLYLYPQYPYPRTHTGFQTLAHH